MFHGRETNNKSNKFPKRALRVVVSGDYLLSFDELLTKDKLF